MRYLLIIVFIIAVVFTCGLSPLLDKQLAALPYNILDHSFYGETHTWCQIIYRSVNVATVLLIAVPLILVIRSYIKNLPDKALMKRMLLISYLSLAIGPGLLVNTFFKDHWGRARPYQVLRDHKPFSYPWQPHFSRHSDNSFPSGHVSIGAFLGIPFILMRRKKTGVLLSSAGFMLVGLIRFLQGGHYFSDIVMAGLIVWIVALLVTALFDKYFPLKVS